MKNKIFLLFLLYIIFSCSDGDFFTPETVNEDIEIQTSFPILYKYKGFEFTPTKYYRIKNENEFESFLPTYLDLVVDGKLTPNQIDSTLLNFPLLEEDLYPIKEIELLSDKMARVKLGEEAVAIDSTFIYFINDQILTINLSPSESIKFKINENLNILSDCYIAYAYTHFSSFYNERTQSIIFGESCQNIENENLLEYIVTKVFEARGDVIELNDTILLNKSNYILEN